MLSKNKEREMNEACQKIVAELRAGERTEEGAEAEIQSICIGFCGDDDSTDCFDTECTDDCYEDGEEAVQ